MTSRHICKIIDSSFAHSKSICHGADPSYFEWYRGDDYFERVFFTDYSLEMQSSVDCKSKIALLIEPPEICSSSYEYVSKNHDSFEYILTCSEKMVSNSNKCLFFHHIFPWIKKEDRMIYKKSKKASIICSSKSYSYGHNFRHKAVDCFKEKIDVFGSGYGEFKNDKISFLKDYMFSVVIMNSKFDCFATEALADCFATCTIPIFWGSRSVEKIFNSDGILFFEDIKDLEEIISNLSDDLYHSKMNAVIENFEKVNKYNCHEDYIFHNYPFLFEAPCITKKI